MKFLNLFSIIFFTFFISGNLIAQTITITTVQELKFGDFYFSDTAGGTVAVSNNGAWTSTGNIQLINSSSPHAATFKISTESLSDVKVEVQSYAENLTKADGTTLLLTANLPDPAVYTISYLNPAHVSIGGNLDISSTASSSPGNYTGSVSIRVTIVQ